MLLRTFNKQATIRRLGEFGSPKIVPFSKLTLPRGSIIHYLPSTQQTEFGPPQTMPYVANAEKLPQIHHVTELAGVIQGRPRKVIQDPSRYLLTYQRSNKQIRRLYKDDLIRREPKVLLIENYAPISSVYTYQQTILSWYDRIHNIMNTFANQLQTNCKKYERQNYVVLNLPNVIPSRIKLKAAQSVRTESKLKEMTDIDSIFILELWTWLGSRRESSVFSCLDTLAASKVNVIVQFAGRFLNINLGELDMWRNNASDKGARRSNGKIQPEIMQQRFHQSLIALAENQITNELLDDGEHSQDEVDEVVDRTDYTEDSEDLEVDEDDLPVIEDVVTEEEDYAITIASDDKPQTLAEANKPVTVDTGVEAACEKFIDAGMLSSKEYKIVLDKATKYKNIPNPYGEGTLADMLEVKPEEVILKAKPMVNDVTTFDAKEMESSANEFTRGYVNKVLPKDIVSSIVSIQKAGVIVEDYDVERVVDAANRTEVHTLKVTPVKGRSTTIRFTLPMLDEEGYWVSNNTRATLKKQRVDLPIRKVGTDAVALTTFYGKNFIQRCQYKNANRDAWICEQIQAAGYDSQNVYVSDMKVLNTFDPSKKLPKDYTTVAQRLSKFRSGDVTYHFDINALKDNFKDEEIKELESNGLVPVGRDRKHTYGMDKFSTIFRNTPEGMIEVGSIPEICNLNVSKMPRAFSELDMMGSTIPLSLIMSYYYGLENMLSLLKVRTTVFQAGERVDKSMGDMQLKLRDCKIVLDFDTPEQEMIVRGFKPYFNIMKEFTLHDYNSREVYLSMIEKDGLTARYLNELDLMDTMYVDPVSERLLKKMKEPTTFRGLLVRANEMLTSDEHKAEMDLTEQHIYGMQRIAGAVYTNLVRATRDMNNKRSDRRALTIPTSQILTEIITDPSVMPSAGSNVMQSIREADSITYGGNGGRSRRSLVKRTRLFTESDLGVVSGDTVDSGDAGASNVLAANAKIADMDGMIMPGIKTNEMAVSSALSVAAMLAPGALYDDDKRVNVLPSQVQYIASSASNCETLTSLIAGSY